MWLLVALLLTPTGDGRVVSPVDGAEMVRIDAGEYTIGDAAGRYDERPAVRVRLSAFLIDRTEVTNARFAAFVRTSGYRPRGPWMRGFPPGGEDLPVRFVTWEDADAYARWAGRRLPTEAEWEVAAGPHRYPWGPVFEPGRAIADRAPSAGPAAASSSFDRTALGVLNLGGNVREWVADHYDRYAYATLDGAADPRGPDAGAAPEARFVAAGAVPGNERSTRRVVRGGGWVSAGAEHARRARRGAENPRHFYDDVGFRCALSLSGGTP